MTIRYTITPKNLHAHLFEVEINIQNPNPLGQVFSLPNWISGSYLIRDFAKHIISIRARSCGERVGIKKLDKNHWITQPCTKNITLKYEVYAFDLSVRSAYLTNERAFFNGSSVFLLPLGFEQNRCELSILPADKTQTLGDWTCATGLEKITDLTFKADNYQHLIDCPVEMARLTLFDFQAKNTRHQMAITGSHNADIKRLKQDLTTICEHHIDFFKGDIPFKNYLFLTLVRTEGYGGLEHRNSSSLICSRKDLPTLDNPIITPEYTRFLALCAHEYFHAWWIKTLKPASFFDLDLNRENYTEQLWIFEGFTAYYDELSLLRTKILSPEQYLTLFAQTITKVQRSAGRRKQTLAESSFESWTKFYQQDENAPNAIVSYYTKGALLAFVLDVEIRKNSADEQSLDDVLRLAWDNYQAFGLENNTLQNIVNDLTGLDFSPFFANYLYGLKELPLKSAFDYIGVDLSFTHQKNDLSAFGMTLKTDGNESLITCIFEGSCAQLSGLYVGDKIISVDGKTLTAKDLPATINAYNESDLLEISILRDELPVNLSVKIKLLEPSFCQLKLKQNPTSTTQKHRLKWFYQE